jgi:uncharacterized delta-60 repeat protein
MCIPHKSVRAIHAMLARMRSELLRWLVSLVPAAAATGCTYDLDYGGAACGPGGQCPTGYTCDSLANRCLTVVPVSGLAAAPLDAKVALTWRNPGGGFAGTTLVRNPAAAPAAPGDGTVIYQGAAESYVDTGLQNRTRYFYAAFALDGAGRAAAPATTSATPLPSGSLDPTFGGGKGFFIHPGAGSGDSFGQAVALDAAGRIVVAGVSSNGVNDDMALWRLTPDGRLDTTFAGRGFVLHDNAGGGMSHDHGNGVAIDGQGRIVVTGYSITSTSPTPVDQDMVVWVYRPEGLLDAGFGGGAGYVTRGGSARGTDFGDAVLIGVGDKIVVGGQTFNANTNYDTSVWGLLPGGDPDPTFGFQGVTTQDMNGDSAGIAALTIALDPAASQRKLIAVGGTGAGDLFAQRYSLDGVRDFRFGTDFNHDSSPDGWRLRAVPMMGFANATAVVADAAGMLYIAGTSFPSTGSDIVVWKQPQPDTTEGPVVTVNLGALAGTARSYDGAAAAVLTPEGLVVVGTSRATPGGAHLLALVRLTADLQLDPSFGAGGVVTFAATAGGARDDGYAVTSDGFGRLVVVGSSNDATIDQMAVWRIIP